MNAAAAAAAAAARHPVSCTPEQVSVATPTRRRVEASRAQIVSNGKKEKKRIRAACHAGTPYFGAAAVFLYSLVACLTR
jgi:cobalamin biosynthesis protein CbiD